MDQRELRCINSYRDERLSDLLREKATSQVLFFSTAVDVLLVLKRYVLLCHTQIIMLYSFFWPYNSSSKASRHCTRNVYYKGVKEEEEEGFNYRVLQNRGKL